MPTRTSRILRPWSVALTCLVLLALAAPAAAAVPGVIQVEGALFATGGGPVADGDYTLTFSLYAAVSGGEAIWSEAGAKVAVKGGSFGYVLGSQQALKPELLAGQQGVWLALKVESEVELPRKALTSVPYTLRAAVAEGIDCSGCVALSHLAADVLAPYAKTASLAKVATTGAYADLAGAPDLSPFAKTAALATVALSGSYADLTDLPKLAKVATTGGYGDLANLPTLPELGKACGTGLVVKGLKADGSYECASAAMTAADLPKDGLDEVSNGLLFNQFNEVAVSPKTPVNIPDNNPVGISDMIEVPDFGTAQALTVSAEVVNSDTANLKINLVDAAGGKYVLWDKTAKGTTVKTTWPTLTKTVSGDLTAWIGKNPKGKWYIEVIDSAFLNNAVDGKLVAWSINVQVLASGKVGVGGALVLKNAADPPFACDASVSGAVYYDNKSFAIRYCSQGVWRSLADTCGNGIVETTEECDDGNNASGDGCNSTCVASVGYAKTKPGKTCDDVLTLAKAEAVTPVDGLFWITGSGTTPFQAYCDMKTEGGGWTLVLNLDTSDGATRHYDDTTFWTGKNPVGSAATWATADFKSSAFEFVTASVFLMRLHNGGTSKSYSTYGLLPAYAGKTLYYLFGNIGNSTITGARDKHSGSVGSAGYSRNAGDAFADQVHPIIINSRYSPLDSDNYTRLGTNYVDQCGTINCNGHNYGGWGGRHFRAGWGAYYEGAALNGYCPAEGGYGTNGSAYNGSDAFGCSGKYQDVDLAVFVK